MKFIGSFMLALWCMSVSACDVCSLFSGVYPGDQKHRISFWQRNRMLEGEFPQLSLRDLAKHLDNTQTVIPNVKYQEQFMSYELRYHHQISKRWSAMGILPVVQRRRVIDQVLQEEASGLGDASLLVQYSPVLSGSEESNLKQRLTIGLGAKAPLGKTQKQFNDEYVDHDLQPGSGSWDALMSLEYLIKWKQTGLLLQNWFSLNGENLGGYRYGNSYTAQCLVFRQFEHRESKIKCIPMIGFSFETLQQDRQDSEMLNHSGGRYTYANAGMEIQHKNVSIQGMWMQVIDQQFNGNQIPVAHRYQIALTYFIDRKS